MTKNKWHPCWWCGCETLAIAYEDYHGWKSVMCEDCEASGPAKPTDRGAVIAWNRGPKEQGDE